MATRRFELSSGTSNKFWEVTSGGRSYTVTWGRIGTAGQSKTKQTASAADEVAALVAEKLRKGYREVSKRATRGSPKAKPADSKPDRARLQNAFRALRKQGYVADGPLGDTPSDGWTEVYEQSGADDAPALFFTSETGRAFKGDTLARKLPLQWRGDPKLIVETLGEHGFRASIPDSEGEAITIVAGPPRKWPANAAITKTKALPTLSASDKKQQYARYSKALAALRKDGWKIKLKQAKPLLYWDAPPPAGTIYVDAGPLWQLPAEVEHLASRRDDPTVRILVFVGGKRKRVLDVLKRFDLGAKLADLTDWTVSIELKP